MSLTVDDRRPGLRSTLSALLAVALLAPLGVLFSQVWKSTTDDIAVIERERRGVEYLARLSQLLTATSQAQASAMQGQAPPESLGQAVARTGEIDQRLGAELATHERWSALRAKIEKLPRATAGQELATFQAHTEASELLLALYRTVRAQAGLARDQQTDTFHLQQAIGDGLPAAVVQASRLADLTTLAPRAAAAQRQQLGLNLVVARQAAADAVERMTDSLQAAADDTRSGTLSSGVLGGLDRFRLGVDGLVQGATVAIDAGAAPPNAGNLKPGDVAAGLARLATIRGGMQVAAGDLAATIFQETDALFNDRIDDLRAQRRTALIALATGALLALIAVLIPVLRRRRSPDRRGSLAAGGGDPGPPVGAPSAAVPVAAGSRARPESPEGSTRRYGDNATAQWERDDVLR